MRYSSFFYILFSYTSMNDINAVSASISSPVSNINALLLSVGALLSQAFSLSSQTLASFGVSVTSRFAGKSLMADLILTKLQLISQYVDDLTVRGQEYMDAHLRQELRASSDRLNAMRVQSLYLDNQFGWMIDGILWRMNGLIRNREVL